MCNFDGRKYCGVCRSEIKPPACFGEYAYSGVCEFCEFKVDCKDAMEIDSRFSEESIFQEGGEGK